MLLLVSRLPDLSSRKDKYLKICFSYTVDCMHLVTATCMFKAYWCRLLYTVAKLGFRDQSRMSHMFIIARFLFIQSSIVVSYRISCGRPQQRFCYEMDSTSLFVLYSPLCYCWRALARQHPILYNSEKKAKSVRCKIEDMRSRLCFLYPGIPGCL